MKAFAYLAAGAGTTAAIVSLMTNLYVVFVATVLTAAFILYVIFERGQ